MPRKEKIAARLPHFYVSWDRGSIISSLVASTGKTIDESEKDLVSIINSHWIDTAWREDLEYLGSIYRVKRKPGELDREYRNRLKSAIVSYKGGGTIGAIRMLLRMLLRLPPDYPVEIVENPPVSMEKTWLVAVNKEWTVNPRSITDARPGITISVETEGGKITDPTLTNLATGESLTYHGDIKTGTQLVISDGQAHLNGKNVTGKLSGTATPNLRRGRSTWRYSEKIGANQGLFDQTAFDEAVFAIEIRSRVTFSWTGYQPACFEVRIPSDLLTKADITADDLQENINAVKASGVEAKILCI